MMVVLAADPKSFPEVSLEGSDVLPDACQEVPDEESEYESESEEDERPATVHAAPPPHPSG